MSKTTFAVKHFALGGRESLETAVMGCSVYMLKSVAFKLSVNVFTTATSFSGSFFGEVKTLVGAGHVPPRIWVVN